MEYIILGNHTAIVGDRAPLIANEDDTVINIMYEKLMSSPSPMLIPIPPLTFFEESDAPIIVNINAANGNANRFAYSISNSLIFPMPLFFCLFM